MNVLIEYAKKLHISNIERLDNVDVYLEDFGDGRGKMTASCFGQSWSWFWGSMGKPLEQFILSCGNDYLIGKQTGYPQTVDDTSSDKYFLRGLLLKERRRGSISKLTARSGWVEINRIHDRETIFYGDIPLPLRGIEGISEPWYFDWPTKPNPEYVYLSRVIDAIKEALVETQQSN